MLWHRHISAAIIAVTLLGAPASALAVTCDSDVDGDGIVGVLDLLDLLGQWGPCPDCTGDVNDDGFVDVLDLLQVIGDWGPCLLEYLGPMEDEEAEQIAYERLGPYDPLQITVESYERIKRDMALLREADPRLAEIPHHPWLNCEHLMVYIPSGTPCEEVHALNTYFQATSFELIAFDWWLIIFPQRLNVCAAWEMYEDAPSVELVNFNNIIGLSCFWTPTDLGDGRWRWLIDEGWHDCFDGCDCHRLYTYDVDADGKVTFISYYEVGMPWCIFPEPD